MMLRWCLESGNIPKTFKEYLVPWLGHVSQPAPTFSLSLLVLQKVLLFRNKLQITRLCNIAKKLFFVFFVLNAWPHCHHHFLGRVSYLLRVTVFSAAQIITTRQISWQPPKFWMLKVFFLLTLYLPGLFRVSVEVFYKLEGAICMLSGAM